MGTKYTSVAVSAFNAAPPSDDGATTANNQVSWSKHLSKIGTPLLNAHVAMDAALLLALNQSARSVFANESTAATDNNRTIEIGSAVTSTITISLADAATMAAGYIVTVANQSPISHTIGRVTTGDTINGVAGNVTIGSMESMSFLVKAGLNGYLIVNRIPPAPFVSSLTRDASTASGTQTITSIPFPPRFVMFFVNINSSSSASWGFMTATASESIFDDNLNAAGTYAVGASSSIYISQAGGAAVVFDFNAFTNDGFVLDVTKINSPTGTITGQFVAFP